MREILILTFMFCTVDTNGGILTGIIGMILGKFFRNCRIGKILSTIASRLILSLVGATVVSHEVFTQICPPTVVLCELFRTQLAFDLLNIAIFIFPELLPHIGLVANGRI